MGSGVFYMVLIRLSGVFVWCVLNLVVVYVLKYLLINVILCSVGNWCDVVWIVRLICVLCLRLMSVFLVLILMCRCGLMWWNVLRCGISYIVVKVGVVVSMSVCLLVVFGCIVLSLWFNVSNVLWFVWNSCLFFLVSCMLFVLCLNSSMLMWFLSVLIWCDMVVGVMDNLFVVVLNVLSCVDVLNICNVVRGIFENMEFCGLDVVGLNWI